MDTDIEQIRSAMDKETSGGRDEALARQLSDSLVAANPDQFSSLENMTVEQLVQAVDVFRAAGMEQDQWRIEAWLLHHFEPQNIGGPVEATVRVVS